MREESVCVRDDSVSEESVSEDYQQIIRDIGDVQMAFT